MLINLVYLQLAETNYSYDDNWPLAGPAKDLCWIMHGHLYPILDFKFNQYYQPEYTHQQLDMIV